MYDTVLHFIYGVAPKGTYNGRAGRRLQTAVLQKSPRSLQ